MPIEVIGVIVKKLLLQHRFRNYLIPTSKNVKSSQLKVAETGLHALTMARFQNEVVILQRLHVSQPSAAAGLSQASNVHKIMFRHGCAKVLYTTLCLLFHTELLHQH